MCKSQAEGGQRCASHTRVAYAQRLTSYLNRATTLQEKLTNQSIDLIEATTLYATTKKGIEEIETDIERFSQDHTKTLLVADLMQALAEGKRQRKVTKEVEAQLKLANRPESNKTQGKIVRGHVEELYRDIDFAVINGAKAIYSFGEKEPIINVEAFQEEVEKRSKVVQEAVAVAYAKFARATTKELVETEPSQKELKERELKWLKTNRDLRRMSRLDYYTALFAIEDKYSSDPEGTEYAYGVYGVAYRGRHHDEEHILMKLFRSLEQAVADNSKSTIHI